MRAPTFWVAALDTTRRWGGQGSLLRALIAMAAAVSMVTSDLIGQHTPVLAVLLAASACFAVSRPDSVAPLLLIAMILYDWQSAVRPGELLWSVVPAGCVLVVHVAAARVAVLPDHARWDRAAGWRWIRQTLLVGAGTLLVWCATVAFGAHTRFGAVALTTAAFIATAGFGLAIRHRTLAGVADG